jgi:hypothetical protein
MKDKEPYTCREKHISNRLWNIAFEKIGFGRRDYYGNWGAKKKCMKPK